jgi:hypothetical protein
MGLRWVACLLCAAAVGMATSGATASASSGTKRCHTYTRRVGFPLSRYATPAACTTTWTCKQANCWYQAFLEVGASSGATHPGMTGQAQVTGLQPGAATPPRVATLKCTWSGSPGNTVGGCYAADPTFLHVLRGYRVNITCWMPALVVPKPYTGGALTCGVRWYS